MRKITASDAARFEALLDKNDPSGCWIFTGYIDAGGYGQFRVGGADGEIQRAHRVAYAIRHGKIPERMQVTHQCGRTRLDGTDQPACCNPAHLRLGTARDNALDRSARSKRKPPMTTQEINKAARLRKQGWAIERIARELKRNKQAIKRVLEGRSK